MKAVARTGEHGVGVATPRIEPRPKRGQGRAFFTSDEWRSIGAELGLSRREFEIVQSVFDDRVEATMAAQMGLSVHTVHTYLGRLYQKLGVGGRAELVIRVFEAYLGEYVDPR